MNADLLTKIKEQGVLDGLQTALRAKACELEQRSKDIRANGTQIGRTSKEVFDKEIALCVSIVADLRVLRDEVDAQYKKVPIFDGHGKVIVPK